MTKLSLVLLQIDIKFGDPKTNRKHISQWFEKADLKPDELVLLPELWDTAYDLEHLDEIADNQGEKAQKFLKDLAQKYQVYICGGSIARSIGKKVFNTTYFIKPSGEIAGHYDKVHLFGLMEEDKYLHAGDHLLQFPIANFTASTLICYDLRFPEWFRKSGSKGADLFLLVAQWPLPRIQQWEKLLQARAIENQAFVAAVNRVGSDPKNQFGGCSMVVDPTGEILLQLDNTESIGRCEIDQRQLKEVRKQIPVFSDRRPDLY